LGALCYAAGLVLSAGATLPIQHQLYEVLVGLGIAGTGFGVVLAVVGRASSDENRSMSLAIVTAAGSAGQVVGPPVAEGLLALMPWQGVFLAFAGMILAVLLVLPWMRSPAPASKAQLQESMGAAVLGALRDPSSPDLPGLLLLRLPARLHHRAFPGLRGRGLRADPAGGALHSMGSRPRARWARSPSRSSGWATSRARWRRAGRGKRYTKKYLLAGIYTGRTIARPGSS
jgi:multisubunit Na+/H+ antiporter MnhC subunit